jgi:hypothetical protein
VLGLPLAFFAFNGPLAVNGELIAGRESNPIPALLLVLTLSVGVPMFVVCTSAPLLQRWFASTDHPAAADPYFLYGASNLGSMLALVGYPVLVEPYLTLRGQRVDWAVGYAGLALLTALCAVLMWKARPAPALAGPTAEPAAPPPGSGRSEAFKAPERGVKRDRDRGAIKTAPSPEPEVEERTRPVTWLRRMYWVALAIVPSSLMLGATTYITTDIAAIPLLWVLPLALYLLTFIIVFAHISPRTQTIITLIGLDGAVLVLIVWVVPLFDLDQSIIWLIRVVGLALVAFSFPILRMRDPLLIHRVMIMVMPLVLLFVIFMMLSEQKPPGGIQVNIALHLLTLFTVSMVCHGELARDRPAPSHLTEYFLWMSFGGVIGGLFNGLLAPLIFNAIVEYPLMMMVACLLLPPLGFASESVWARRADLALTGVFLAVGGLLLFMRWRDGLPDLEPLRGGPWQWGLAVFLLGGALGGVAAWQGWGNPPREDGQRVRDHWLDRLLDVGLPLALLVLVLGLYWGLTSKTVWPRVVSFADMLKVKHVLFRAILTFGLPAVLAYTFVERSVRFGLGVGVIMLGAGLSGIVYDSPLFQERSFFGVLRVEEGANFYPDKGVPDYRYPTHRLVHGTTLHGKQFIEDDLHDIPLSYYHRTGPVGQVFRALNTDPKRPVAVIGLGTGTMACYGLKGQRFDFFDIDPVVVGISFDTNEHFTFVEDAEGRGVDINLVLGDARLTFDPASRIDHARLKPMHKRKDEKAGARTFGEPLSREQKYGLIVVDAFSSDAIPIHLITREAVEIYRERLLDDGVLCMHISNRHLDLQPVLANIVDELGLVGFHLSDKEEDIPGKSSSHWVAITRKKENLERVMHPPRWKSDPGQLSLLGASLWPAQAGTAMASSTALAFAIHRAAEVAAREQERTSGKPAPSEWKPLDTIAELERRIEEAPDDAARARLAEKLLNTRKVGVWSDDYSNLLSVFNW